MNEDNSNLDTFLREPFNFVDYYGKQRSWLFLEQLLAILWQRPSPYENQAQYDRRVLQQIEVTINDQIERIKQRLNQQVNNENA